MAFQRLQAALPEGLQISDPVPIETPLDKTEAIKPSYCLCVMPEGEYPTVKVFRSAEGLVRRIGKLEGTEVAVWPFFGLPLWLTTIDRVGRRYLLLPNAQGLEETHAIPIPVKEFEKFEVLKVLDIDFELERQEDGWLGDPTLAQASSADYYQSDSKKSSVAKKGKKKKNKTDLDDEEEPV